MDFVEVLKIIFLGIVEGITEWLPVSSTGHMLLVDEFLQLNFSDEFKTMFFVVIQLGAIMAVVLIFWKKIFPFYKNKKNEIKINQKIVKLWIKVIIACVPSIIIGLPFDDLIEEKLYSPTTIAITLIIYGIAFIIVENYNKNKTPQIKNVHQITYKTALIIGAFQVLALIPGTSRSGATIVGALIFGVSRVAASEFTFYLAIPTMFGASLLKLVKFGLAFTGAEVVALLLGMIVAFAVSMFAITFLMNYVKKHDFKVFGWYRIVLGLIVLVYFLVF
ncbi:MAG: undecaprenyl-diphosphate phosphatase [Clostridia bacterium]